MSAASGPGVSSRGSPPGVILALVVVFAACYLVFGGSLPFSGSPFVLKAVFTSNTDLHIPSPVRIAGVDVGEVTSVDYIAHGSDAAIVTMDIDQNGLPIHSDATAQIRSRIFLEGNFYVDLHPGAPSSPILGSGATLPAANTSGPVQLNRILSSLTASPGPTCRRCSRGLGASLNEPADHGRSDASQDPSVRGLTGGQALNQSLKYSTKAFRASAIVNQALLGIQPHDLRMRSLPATRRCSAGSRRAGPAFRRPDHNVQLDDVGARRASAAARRDDLDAAAAAAQHAGGRHRARRLVPADAGVRPQDPARDQAARPDDQLPRCRGSAQATALVSPSELGGLLSNLTPAVDKTASTIGSTKQLVSGLDQLALCFSHNIVPAGNQVIQDPPADDRAAGLPGAVPERGRDRRRVRQLRRQRPLRPILGGRWDQIRAQTRDSV